MSKYALNGGQVVLIDLKGVDLNIHPNVRKPRFDSPDTLPIK